VGAINFGRRDALGGDAKAAALSGRHRVCDYREPLEGHPIRETPTTEVKSEEGTEPGAGSPPRRGPRNVVAEVEFSGLKDWQDMRGRLMNVAGIQALEVNSLSARAASITFDYAGSLGRLQKELDQTVRLRRERGPLCSLALGWSCCDHHTPTSNC
jgi:hypothetical protein